MKFEFKTNAPAGLWANATKENWCDWRWQMRKSLKTEADYARVFTLTDEERDGFRSGEGLFQVRTTPYYAQLAHPRVAVDPIRRIFMPLASEVKPGVQQMFDPLGERKNLAAPRLIHRYSDRVLFLVTDVCSVYCRYCTRKHFTGGDDAMMAGEEYESALQYIRSHTGLREVILSGGDPLTLSDEHLDRILSDLRQIDHVEIIRIGTRMPVVNPFRVTPALVAILREAAPVFLMTHFNHPRELTLDAAMAVERFVDHGIPVMNQMVLLNGINNHPAIVQALSRRLLFLRAKPYYMFQCDPSEGTDHLRTSVDESLWIQKELWGHLSGLAMPSLALDIPDGGGKSALVPNFQTAHQGDRRSFRGWDGVAADYISPPLSTMIPPLDTEVYLDEWERLKAAKDPKNS